MIGPVRTWSGVSAGEVVGEIAEVGEVVGEVAEVVGEVAEVGEVVGEVPDTGVVTSEMKIGFLHRIFRYLVFQLFMNDAVFSSLGLKTMGGTGHDLKKSVIITSREVK